MATRFWERAMGDPDRVALVESSGEEFTAGELLGVANQVVHAGRRAGMEAGDTIAVLLPNGHELFEVYLAAMQSGWYLTPINHHLTGVEVAHIVADSGSKVLVAHERFEESAAIALGLVDQGPVTWVVGDATFGRPWRDVLATESVDLPFDRRSGGIMYYTSGTTGRPKGVRRQLANCGPDEAEGMYSELLRLCGVTSSPDDVHLCTSPLYHTAVLAFATDALHGGQRVVIMDRWNAARALELIQEQRVTNTHVVPTQFHRLLAEPDRARAQVDVSSLRYVLHGAAPCPVEVKRKMIQWWGPVIVEYYGTTEGGGTVVTSGEWLQRPGTVGRPWPGAEIRILDEAGQPTPTGEPGLVYIKLGAESFEYRGDPEKTAANRIGDFFTVGDIGYLDQDGYLFLCDRVTDVIIAGGVNIYPAEIEGALLAHPGVADAAVVGALDDALGERVVAVVQMRADYPSADKLMASLPQHCAPRLAKFKVPSEFRVVDSLPRDPNGKLPRRVVREAIRADRNPPVSKG